MCCEARLPRRSATPGPARRRQSSNRPNPRARCDPLKLSLRVSRQVARRLDLNGRAAGLSRGAYLMRLINGAPPVIPSADRTAGFAALNASASELALLSRDINHLTQLLSKGSIAAARAYRGRLDSLEGDVRKHLELSAAVIAELMSDRKGRAWVGDRRSSSIGCRP